MAAKNSTSDKDTPYEEELELLNNEEEELDDHEKSLSDVLRTLNKSLATMATSMVAMERSVKRSAPIETSDSESSLAKKRKKQATRGGSRPMRTMLMHQSEILKFESLTLLKFILHRAIQSYLSLKLKCI